MMGAGNYLRKRLREDEMELILGVQDARPLLDAGASPTMVDVRRAYPQLNQRGRVPNGYTGLLAQKHEEVNELNRRVNGRM